MQTRETKIVLKVVFETHEAHVLEHGAPVLDAGGNPTMLIGLAPRETVRFLGNWDVIGLRGTIDRTVYEDARLTSGAILDQAINDRGVLMDTDLAHAAIRAVCGQLIQASKALQIERAIIRACASATGIRSGSWQRWWRMSQTTRRPVRRCSSSTSARPKSSRSCSVWAWSRACIISWPATVRAWR